MNTLDIESAAQAHEDRALEAHLAAQDAACDRAERLWDAVTDADYRAAFEDDCCTEGSEAESKLLAAVEKRLNGSPVRKALMAFGGAGLAAFGGAL